MLMYRELIQASSEHDNRKILLPADYEDRRLAIRGLLERRGMDSSPHHVAQYLAVC